jgi:hypothetical protein
MISTVGSCVEIVGHRHETVQKTMPKPDKSDFGIKRGPEPMEQMRSA